MLGVEKSWNWNSQGHQQGQSGADHRIYCPCRYGSSCVEWLVRGDEQKWKEEISTDDKKSLQKVFLVLDSKSNRFTA